MTDRNILVLGIGNVMMEDEGVGVEVIRFMQRREFPPNVRILDGGTGGFNLLESISGFPIVIMIDAALDSDDEGSIKITEPKFSTDFPKALSAHDIGLKDLVESLILLEQLPKIYLFTISIKKFHNVKMELSESIRKVVPIAAEKIEQLLEDLKNA